MKINKLGMWFVVIHSVIVLAIAIFDSLNFSRGFGLLAILAMDFPAAFIIVPLSDVIDSIFKISSFILIPGLAVILGGLQWYVIGWLISKLKQRLSRG